MKDNWILINELYINKNHIMEICPIKETYEGKYCFEIVMSDGTCHMTSGTDEASIRDLYHLVVQKVTGDLQQCVSEI